MSDRIPASEGGVSRPSGHQPWSSGPQWKITWPLSVNRQWPSASRTLPTVRMPAYDRTSSATVPDASSSETTRSYRCGDPGDQSRAFFTASERLAPSPFVSATVRPASLTTTRSVRAPPLPPILGRTVMVPAPASVPMVRSST